MFEKGQTAELEIVDMSDQGKGIGKAGGHSGGLAVFVDRTVPGDTVKVRITKVKKHYAYANLIKIIEPSEHRIAPLCPYADICGGCAFAHLDYEGQLDVKYGQVMNKLRRIGGVEDPVVRPVISMAEPFHYRNKVTYSIGAGGLTAKNNGIAENTGKPAVGFFRGNTHEVVNCRKCMLQSAASMACAEAVRQYMKESGVTAWDGKWQKGLMRRLVVRTGFMTGEVMAILVVNGRKLPNQERLIELLRQAVHESGYSLESVFLNVNTEKGEQVYGKEMVLLDGCRSIREKFGDLTYGISPLSFYQVNPVMARMLYDKVIEYADLQGEENVLDLYCGVGSIGLWCAKKAGFVVGIESVRDAVEDAGRNAEINDIKNTRFLCGRAEDLLPEMTGMKPAGRKYEEITLSVVNNADVAILDPPRAGCDRALLEAVIKTGPAKIVYVSCDPATLARDIKILTEGGYKFIEATPADLFPHTRHIETCCLLEKTSL